MRYLKITLSGAVLFLLYLWVTILLNSCNNAKPTANETSEDIEMLEEEIEDLDYTDNEFEGGSDEDFDGKSEVVTEQDAMEIEDVVEDDEYVAGDYTAEPEKTTLTPRKKKAKPSKAKTFEASSTRQSSSAGSSGGTYMVIAGSYLLEDNARKMIKKLQGMGYSNAEIIYFDQSQYHSICAGRYDSNSSAKQTANSLQNSGIDSYVHKRQ